MKQIKGLGLALTFCLTSVSLRKNMNFIKLLAFLAFFLGLGQTSLASDAPKPAAEKSATEIIAPAPYESDVTDDAAAGILEEEEEEDQDLGGEEGPPEKEMVNTYYSSYLMSQIIYDLLSTKDPRTPFEDKVFSLVCSKLQPYLLEQLKSTTIRLITHPFQDSYVMTLFSSENEEFIPELAQSLDIMKTLLSQMEANPEAYTPFIAKGIVPFFPASFATHYMFDKFKLLNPVKGESVVDIGGLRSQKTEGVYIINILENDGPDCQADITRPEHLDALLESLREHRFDVATVNAVPFGSSFLIAMRAASKLIKDGGEIHINCGIEMTNECLRASLEAKDLQSLNEHLSKIGLVAYSLEAREGYDESNVSFKMRKL